MEFALTLRELTRRRLLLAAGVVVAVLAAVLSVYHVNGTKLTPRSLQYASASTQLLIDTPQSSLGDVAQDLQPLITRATIVANVMASPAAAALIGRYSGIPGDQIYAAGPVDPLEPRTVTEPTALKRNTEVTGETEPYRLQFFADPTLPTIGVTTQAPTTAQALALANGSASAISSYLQTLQTQERIPTQSWVTVRQLGTPIGGIVDGGISKKLAGIVFVAVLAFWCVLILLVARFRENWRASREFEREWQALGHAPDEVEHWHEADAHQTQDTLARASVAGGGEKVAGATIGSGQPAGRYNGNPNGNGRTNGNGLIAVDQQLAASGDAGASSRDRNEVAVGSSGPNLRPRRSLRRDR